MRQKDIDLLRGVRILIVEDEPLLSMAMVDEIEEAGACVVGPAVSIEGAMELLATTPVDAAILDVELQKQLIYPVADRLMEQGVPFVLTTGHDAEVLPERYATVPHSAKPAPASEALALLAGLLNAR